MLSRVLRPNVHSANFPLTVAGRIDHPTPFIVNDSFCIGHKTSRPYVRFRIV
jgi:hypothetical protein